MHSGTAGVCIEHEAKHNTSSDYVDKHTVKILRIIAMMGVVRAMVRRQIR